MIGKLIHKIGDFRQSDASDNYKVNLTLRRFLWKLNFMLFSPITAVHNIIVYYIITLLLLVFIK